MFRKIRNDPRLQEWALNVNEGLSYSSLDDELNVFEDASRRPPMYRTRRAMLTYVKVRNARRFRRLQSDYQWLRKCVAEMGLNPDDARFLL